MKLNKIYHRDCVEGMSEIKDNAIDLTVTSPPYGEIRDYEGVLTRGFDFQTIAKSLYRITKKGGVLVWVTNDQTVDGSETGFSFRQALYFKDLGFFLHDTMIAMKDNFSFPESNRYPQTFDYMFVFSKGKPKTFNPIKDRVNKHPNILVKGTQRQKDGSMKKDGSSMRLRKHYGEKGIRFNVWRTGFGGYNQSTKDKEAYKHPAIFPESLVRDHILTWSNPNDIVFDPMAGSGTTLKMAKILNRRFIGFEIVEKYYRIACKRIEFNSLKPII